MDAEFKTQNAVFSRWIEHIPPLGAGDKLVRCAQCGKTPDGGKTPYCPYCGAKWEMEAQYDLLPPKGCPAKKCTRKKVKR